MNNIEQLTELCRRQAHRIDELEATLQALMVAADWHISSVGEAIDNAREHIIQIKIPLRIVRASDRFGDWLNTALWQRGRVDVRVVDVLTAIGGVICVGWYAYAGGWFGALQGALAYVFCVMVGLWILR